MCDNEEEILGKFNVEFEVGPDLMDNFNVKLYRYTDSVCKKCTLDPKDRCKEITRPLLEIEGFDNFDYTIIPKLAKVFTDLNTILESEKVKWDLEV